MNQTSNHPGEQILSIFKKASRVIFCMQVRRLSFFKYKLCTTVVCKNFSHLRDVKQHGYNFFLVYIFFFIVVTQQKYEHLFNKNW